MTGGTDAAPAFTQHYEALRAWGSSPRRRRPARRAWRSCSTVFSRSWLAAWPAWHPPQRAPDSTVDPRAAGRVAPAARHWTLTQVLATMVEWCQREGER